MGIRRWLRELTASGEEAAVLHAVDDAPRFAIGKLPEQTLGTISGTVIPGDDRRLIAPLSRRTCLCWGFKIQGGNTTVRRREGFTFVLADDTHRARIDPARSNVLIAASYFSKCVGMASAEEHQRRLLRDLDFHESNGASPSGMKNTVPTYRFSEWIIDAGMVLAVVGSGIREPDQLGDGGYREVGTLIHISGTLERPISITDET